MAICVQIFRGTAVPSQRSGPDTLSIILKIDVHNNGRGWTFVGTPLDSAEHLEVCPDEEFPQTISNGSRTPLDIAGSEFTASLPPPRQSAGVSIVGCQSIALSLYHTLRIGVLLGGIACALERAAIAFCDWVSFK